MESIPWYVLCLVSCAASWPPAFGAVPSCAYPAGHVVVWTLGGWWTSLPWQYNTIQYNTIQYTVMAVLRSRNWTRMSYLDWFFTWIDRSHGVIFCFKFWSWSYRISSTLLELQDTMNCLIKRVIIWKLLLRFFDPKLLDQIHSFTSFFFQPGLVATLIPVDDQKVRIQFFFMYQNSNSLVAHRHKNKTQFRV